MIIEQWFKELCALPDPVWAEHERRLDPLGRLVTRERYLELFQGSVECGRREALALGAAREGAGLDDLARELGAKVTDKPYARDAGRPTFACFFEPDQIELYSDNITETQALLDDGGLSSVIGELSVRDVLLAHELFHVVAQRSRERGETLFCNEKHVELPGINKLFGRRSTLPTLEEGAAMAFARELSGCPCNPFVLNVLMLLPADPDRASNLHREIMDIARELGATGAGPDGDDVTQQGGLDS